MKHLKSLLLTVLCLTTVCLYSQPQKGDINLNAGIGTGFYYYTGSSLATPPVGASLDYNVEDRFSVGGIVTYSSSVYNYYEIYGGKYTFTYIVVGVRGNYHFPVSEKIDPYLGAVLAYNLFSSHWNGAYQDPNYRFSEAAILPGFYAGGRYKFKKNLGAFLELGYPMVRIGVNVKLN